MILGIFSFWSLLLKVQHESKQQLKSQRLENYTLSWFPEPQTRLGCQPYLRANVAHCLLSYDLWNYNVHNFLLIGGTGDENNNSIL